MEARSLEKLTVRAVRIEMEIGIAAPRQRVWKALVGEIGAWWPRDFYAGKDPKAFILEPRVGGRMYEDWGEGAGLLWFTVVGIEPPAVLELAGHLFPAYGGPATSLVRLALSDSKGGTVLHLSDAIHGALREDTDHKLDTGWRQIFENAFKKHVEADQE